MPSSCRPSRTSVGSESRLRAEDPPASRASSAEGQNQVPSRPSPGYASICADRSADGRRRLSGSNAVIRAVVRKGVQVYGDEFVGFRDGWRGPLEGDSIPSMSPPCGESSLGEARSWGQAEPIPTETTTVNAGF